MRTFVVCTTWSSDRLPISRTELAPTIGEGARMAQIALALGALSAHCEMRQYLFGRLIRQKIVYPQRYEDLSL
jgi:hypothetical protein